VLESAWRDDGTAVGQMPVHLPANHQPADLPTRMAPRLIELCFQTAGLWEMGTKGRLALPQHIDHVALLRRPETADGPLYAVVVSSPDARGFDADVVDTSGVVYVTMRGYRTVELPTPVDEAVLEPVRRAIGPER